MEIIRGGRGSGKTTKLVAMAATHKYHIVCPSYAHVKHIENIAKELKLDIPKPITIHDLEKLWGIGMDKKVLIDDIDTTLRVLFRREVRAVTITGEVGER